MAVESLQQLLVPEQIYGLLFVFLRLSTILLLLPFLGSPNLPAIWKVGFILALSLLITKVTPLHPLPMRSGVEMLIIIGTELILGLALGLSVRLILAGFEMAGQFIGFQMGFTIVNVVDPQSGTQSSIMSQLSSILTILVFLTANGHHYLIQAVVASFDLLPPGGFSLTPGVYHKILTLSGEMFVVAFKIAAPVMTALLLATVALGIVSKSVPQMNVLIVGFPLNIGVGLLLFGLSMEIVVPYPIRFLKRSLPVLELIMR